MTIVLGPSTARQLVLARRIRWFVAATITYNVIEAVVALAAGTTASSSALIGFGLDSVVEVSSAAAVAWQFAGRDPEARERIAVKIIACSFFGLAAFVTVDSVRSLVGGVDADHSTVGLVLAAVSLVIMPLLSYGQRRTGRELGSRSAVADSKQTLLCTYLSAVLLLGLGLNWLLGWSWADPIAALVIAGIAVKEGVQAWRGDACCTPAAGLLPAAVDDSCGCEPAQTQTDPTQTSQLLTVAPTTGGPAAAGPFLIQAVSTSWAPDECTLPTVDLPLRLAEFDDLFAQLRDQTVLDAHRLRWTLPGETESAVRDLTARESACCSFFTFTVTAAGDRDAAPDRPVGDVVVDVSVPPARGDVLAALADRAESLISRA